MEESRTSYYAHSFPEKAEEEWQPLENHLKKVAQLAAGFAEPLGGGNWAYLAGILHDVGKYSNAFQNYLVPAANSDVHVADIAMKIDHSTAGAQYAVEKYSILGHILGYIIAGHHSGLLNGRSTGASQEKRLSKNIEPWKHGLKYISFSHDLKIPFFLKTAFAKKDAFSTSFFTRMIFSCLADADFLDTEIVMNAKNAKERPTWPEDILIRMDYELKEYSKYFNTTGFVNEQRDFVRKACLASSIKKPGFFSLTVPTGGGKTLSSLSFALNHALKHDLRQVIYIVPFTTIIEQNADVFRNVMRDLSSELGLDIVLEHHSNYDPEKETTHSCLATENWDAPLVVTTSVQFYESLFSNRPSHCRKLHRLAKAVIILDEVQTLPVDFLEPCIRALCELTSNYGSTVVLCTATQPALQSRKDFPIGIETSAINEIIPEPKNLYEMLKRTNIQNIGRCEDTELSKRILTEKQALCIVNTRSHAKILFNKLKKFEGSFHLSALMCPAHRIECLSKIHDRLINNLPCRVISTQLIEAGIDIDFPVVFRSLAGSDSIAQAAGRCNRNGLIHGKGRVVLFRSEHTLSERFIAETADCAAQILELYDDILSIEAIEHYFKLYYWAQDSRWDSRKILDNFHLLRNDPSFPFSFFFANTARDFRLIDNIYRPVIVPWREKGRDLCEQLYYMDKPGSGVLKKLQRFTVSIPERIWWQQINRNFELIHDRFALLISPEMHYSEQIGLDFDETNLSFLQV